MQSSNPAIKKYMFGVFVATSMLLSSPVIAQNSVDAPMSTSDANAYNEISLVNEGNDNLASLQQAGELNSLNLLIQANNATIDILQQGSANLVAGINGTQAFLLAGHNSRLDIIQNGTGNQVLGMQLSANSSISVSQLGAGNTATIIQR